MCDIITALKHEHYMNIYFIATLKCFIRVVWVRNTWIEPARMSSIKRRIKRRLFANRTYNAYVPRAKYDHVPNMCHFASSWSYHSRMYRTDTVL